MGRLEDRIKDFVRDQGVGIVGVAGPDRLDGPPSLDPTYTMKGARSVVAFAIPMDVDAIHDYLGKKSAASHNLDQLKGNQRVNRISLKAAEYIESLGYKSSMVLVNSNLRRSLNPIIINPKLSHRFTAMVSGIGGQGLSGNVMTKQHGASVYLGSVVTEAELESDPQLPPRYFMDNECDGCGLCAHSCAPGMFVDDDEEAVLINGELHPRGKRRNIMLCMASCFGMHALSRDKKWTTWGRHWIEDWVGDKQDPSDWRKILENLSRAVGQAGDSAPRYEIIRKATAELHAEELLESQVPDYKDLPDDELERNRLMEKLVEDNFDIKGLADPMVLTCGNCGLVCGPDMEERADRFHMLTESGLVVPGPEGRMVHCDTYEEAREIKEKHPHQITTWQRIADQMRMTAVFGKNYLGVEPKSFIQARLYDRRLKKAIEES